MKHLLQSEQFLGSIGSLCLLYFIPVPFGWGWYFLLFWLPDIGMLGYLAGNKVGALTYNAFHHKGIALCMAVAGLGLGMAGLMVAGILLFSHAAFDRVMGYGLKHFTGFKHTHLGVLPEKEKQRG